MISLTPLKLRVAGISGLLTGPGETYMQRSQAVGLGVCGGWPDQTVHRSPAFRAYLTGPGRTSYICRLSSHLQISGESFRYQDIFAGI